MESILTSVKKMLGITEDYTAFDPDIIMAINSAFFILWQHKVGRDPSKPFMIHDDGETWLDFVEDGEIEIVKNYVALRVRLLFDPPSSGFLVENIKEQIKEFEVRMLYATDND